MSEKKPKKLEQVFAEEASSNPSPSWETFEPGDGSQNATASIGHWHDFNGAGPAYEPGELKEQIEANTAAIEANRVLIDQNTADTQQDHQQITANTAAIADNAVAIELLANRVKDIEDFLGAVEITIPLGTGRWIYDTQSPPMGSHFTSTSRSLAVDNTFVFSTGSKDAATLQWENARVGDYLFIDDMDYDPDVNGYFLITYFARVNEDYEADPSGDWYLFGADCVNGKGDLQPGSQFSAQVTRKAFAFTPPEDPE